MIQSPGSANNDSPNADSNVRTRSPSGNSMALFTANPSTSSLFSPVHCTASITTGFFLNFPIPLPPREGGAESWMPLQEPAPVCMHPFPKTCRPVLPPLEAITSHDDPERAPTGPDDNGVT